VRGVSSAAATELIGIAPAAANLVAGIADVPRIMREYFDGTSFGLVTHNRFEDNSPIEFTDSGTDLAERGNDDRRARFRAEEFALGLAGP